MEVDNKSIMSEAKMSDLIKQAVTKETDTLCKELKKLKKDSSPHPKVKRGHCQGALEKEKKDKTTSKGKKKTETEKKA